MRIALTAEGTYPHQFGGVSVWCDQLVRGLPEYDFELVALVATGGEPVRWSLPANVTGLSAIPLWGPPPGARGSRWRRPRSAPPVRELIDILLSPPEEGQEEFGAVLRGLYEYAQQGNLSAALASEETVRLLSDAWRDRWPDPELAPPTLQDAVQAVQLLEHALRPLSYPAPRADVVHAVTNGLGALPALAAKWQYGTPIVVTEHGIYMREHYLHSRQDPYRWPVKQFHLQFLRRLCTLGYQESEVITPGNVYNQRWEQQLGADLDRVRTVYNGVDPADFPALDSEPEVPTISWAGRLDPVKDLETLLRAFALVRQEMPEARLRIFGSAPAGREAYVAKCEALAADLGLDQTVAFEGRVARISDAYAAGHVVVLCSISEGFPYTLIEAMTCGRPCVATDVGGVREAAGDTGLVVPPRHPAELADACLTLLRDRGLRQRLGRAARLRALEYFTVDRAISAFDEIYMFLGTGRPLPVASGVPPLASAPGSAQPGSAQPGSAQPGSAQPGSAQPVAAQPGSALLETEPAGRGPDGPEQAEAEPLAAGSPGKERTTMRQPGRGLSAAGQLASGPSGAQEPEAGADETRLRAVG